jgi:RNA polymerase sigma-70 factor (ECF subfamily)
MQAVRANIEVQASPEAELLRREPFPQARLYVEHDAEPDCRTRSARARRSFERAVLPWHATLLITAQTLTRDRADAEDLLQETLLRAWRFWPRYREQDSCRAWLQRILNNVFYSEHRSRSRRRLQLAEYAQTQLAPNDTHMATLAATEPHRRVTHEQLERSMAALSHGQRRILHLVEVDECSYRETALALACPVGTVMSRLHRARAALRAELTRGACQQQNSMA